MGEVTRNIAIGQSKSVPDWQVDATKKVAFCKRSFLTERQLVDVIRSLYDDGFGVFLQYYDFS